MATNEAGSQAIIEALEEINPEYILYLPSSTLKRVINYCLSRPQTRVFPIPREEEGVGILAGLELAGRRAVMIIQDNGIGNLLTALLTFPQAYHIPQLYIVARRGGLGEYNSMIHTFSERTEAILEASHIRYFSLDSRTPVEEWRPALVKAYAFSRITHRPIMVLCNLMGG
ncbi:MAG: thiamine pyrophosphate-binding protein [Nitrospinota bacterium]|nr:MAG: thiamine pyrophosphate-binding protein [Nitrospinota bacterium]